VLAGIWAVPWAVPPPALLVRLARLEQRLPP